MVCYYDSPPDVIHLFGNHLVAVLQRHHGKTSCSIQQATQRHQVHRATLLRKYYKI